MGIASSPSPMVFQVRLLEMRQEVDTAQGGQRHQSQNSETVFAVDQERASEERPGSLVT